jgi:hypothetical protein
MMHIIPPNSTIAAAVVVMLVLMLTTIRPMTITMMGVAADDGHGSGIGVDGKPSIGLLKLVMMVKNEAHTIRDTLASVSPYIDSWLIMDTGSNDGTQSVIRDYFSRESPIRGRLLEEPFIDFSTSRNVALDAASDDNDTHWHLLLDGDDYLRDPNNNIRRVLTSFAQIDTTCIQTK